ncbi:uncharacterized protein [Diadema antillarum]|uniref:uncharacterized protein isoform X1 n=1 Tax=Diadema antillarum TaxID=105358 RepID=UPI003A8C2ED7
MSAPPSYEQATSGAHGVATIPATSTTVQPPAPYPQQSQLPYPPGSTNPVPYPPAPYSSVPLAPGTAPVGASTVHGQYTVQTSYPHMNVQPGMNTVVTAPQGVTIIRQVQPMPDDNLQCAIFVTLCCCFVFGLIAIVKSQEARRLHMAGDTEGARRAASTSRSLSTCGVVVGLVLIGASLVLRFVALSY